MLFRFSALIITGFLFRACFPSIRITENTTARFSFEWTLDSLAITKDPKAGVRLFFPDENVELGENNEPVIPGYSFSVGVPQTGEPSVSFSAVRVRTVVLPAPLEKWSLEKGAPVRYPGLRFAGPWISEAAYGRLWRLRSARFIVRPFLYDAASNTLRVLDKGEFTVVFPRSAATGRPVIAPAVRRLLSNLMPNWERAVAWAQQPALAKAGKSGQVPFSTTRPSVRFKVGDGHSGYNEGTTNENGIVRIGGATLVGMLGRNIPIRQVGVYASFRGEMPLAAPDISAFPDGMKEVPVMRCDVNGNGILDSSDYLLAYVSGASDWVYDALNKRYVFSLNRYDDYRRYWVADKGAAYGMELKKNDSLSVSGPQVVNSFSSHLLLKKSTRIIRSGTEEGGLDWLWFMLTRSNQQDTVGPVDLPLVNVNGPCSLQVKCEGGSSPKISFGDARVCDTCASERAYAFSYGGDRSLHFTAGSSSVTDTLQIESVEFQYERNLELSAAAPSMTVFSPQEGNAVRYRLTGLPHDLVYIVRISADGESLSLVDTVRTATGAYEWNDIAGAGLRYFCCTQAGVRDAPQLEQVTMTPGQDLDFVYHDLRNLPSLTDYLIIAHDMFKNEAHDLAKHKSHIGRFTNPAVVLISDVYNQFSGGNVDPAAVRNFVEWAKSVCGDALQFVVLMGGGHYDYKGFRAVKPLLIPVSEIGSSCIEDFFVCIHSGDMVTNANAIPDLALGRLPCFTEQEAAVMVSKIIVTENPDSAKLGAWKNRMLFVADDDVQGTHVDSPDHLNYSEELAGVIAGRRPSLDIRKIYEIAYEANSQMEKPDVAQAIFNEFNDGVAFVNFFGHGGRTVWTDEHVLLPENVARMTNNKLYPLVSSFSCNVGMFDMPDSARSLSEDLVIKEKGGAVAAIAADRLSNAPPNKSLAVNFYRSVFDTTKTAPQSLGEAFMLAKRTVGDINNKAYLYLGDPSLSCGRPGRRIGLEVKNRAGAAIDTLKAFEQVTVVGTVRDPATGMVDPSFGGGGRPDSVYILLVNPPQEFTKVGTLSRFVMTYDMPGVPIVVGQALVTNGSFSQQFLLPKTLAFGKPGAKLMAYAWHRADGAAGADASILFWGYDTSAVKDSTGPLISVRLLYLDPGKDTAAQKGIAFTDKITCHLPFSFEIDVFDSNGIDISGTGPDEGLSLEIPGVMPRQNISGSKFQFRQGDFRAGSTTKEFYDSTQIMPGTYSINISAQDMLGNLSKKSVQLTVTAAQALAMSHVFNYPNPMKKGGSTRFYFDLSRTEYYTAADMPRVFIKVYTLSGRLLRIFTNAVRGELFDGRDQYGNELSPGVYLYRVYVQDRNNQNKTIQSDIMKLAVNPPR
jgi:hypothetical protein